MVALFYKWFLLLALPLQAMHTSPATFSDPHTQNSYHPFYVSVTEVNHNAKEKALEISCKIFADDMEDILKQLYKVKVDLTDTKQQAQNDKLITDYIKKHLAVTADGKGLPLTYIGFEKDSESVFCYFEAANVAAVKKIELTNSILQDFTDKQINIMHVMVNNNRKSYKLDYPNKQASFLF